MPVGLQGSEKPLADMLRDTWGGAKSDKRKGLLTAHTYQSLAVGLYWQLSQLLPLPYRHDGGMFSASSNDHVDARRN